MFNIKKISKIEFLAYLFSTERQTPNSTQDTDVEGLCLASQGSSNPR